MAEEYHLKSLFSLNMTPEFAMDRRHCTDRHIYWIKNDGFPLNLGQLRTSDYRNLTLPTPSGQKFLMKILIFSALRNLFCSKMGSNGRKWLKMIKNDPNKPKLLFWESFVTFLKNFWKFFRFWGGVGIFKGLKSHDAGSSGMKTWYQNVRKEANFKMSNIKLLGEVRPELYGYFSQKNVEINAT